MALLSREVPSNLRIRGQAGFSLVSQTRFLLGAGVVSSGFWPAEIAGGGVEPVTTGRLVVRVSLLRARAVHEVLCARADVRVLRARPSVAVEA